MMRKEWNDEDLELGNMEGLLRECDLCVYVVLDVSWARWSKKRVLLQKYRRGGSEK